MKLLNREILKKHPRIVLISFIIIVLFVIELLSGIAIFSAHHFLGTPKRISLFKFHPMITGVNISQYEFDWAQIFPVFGYVNRINVSDECSFTTDQEGFIHNGDPLRKIKPEHFSVFLVGGSTVAGHGSSCNDQTISAHLERLLRKEYENIDVINAGVSGYHSPQELHKIANEIMFYDPDLVIAFSGTNDFFYNYEEHEGRKHSYYVSNYQKNIFETLLNTKSLFWSIKNLIYNLTRFTEYTYTRFVVEKGAAALLRKKGGVSKKSLLAHVQRDMGVINVPQNDIKYKDSEYKQILKGKMSYHVMCIKETAALIEGLGVPYYFVLQPTLLVESEYLTNEEAKALDIVRYSYYKKYNMDIVKRAKYYWSQLDKELRATKINYFNFSDIFSNDKEDVYYEHVHYNDDGNLKIAKKLYQILVNGKAIPNNLYK